MTGLGGQLAAALKRLSAQSRTEQRQHADERRRHSEQVEALRQRIERQAAGSATLRRQFERLDARILIIHRRGLTIDRAVDGICVFLSAGQFGPRPKIADLWPFGLVLLIEMSP